MAQIGNSSDSSKELSKLSSENHEKNKLIDSLRSECVDLKMEIAKHTDVAAENVKSHSKELLTIQEKHGEELKNINKNLTRAVS